MVYQPVVGDLYTNLLVVKFERDKGEAEELFKREELDIMERIEREKHDIEREKISSRKATQSGRAAT